MKLWEVLKALEENPEKEFECVGMRLIRESGTYRFINVNTRERNFYMGVDNDWQEIKKPVTWQEALEAWANGKPIKCECEFGIIYFKPPRQSSACLTAKLITHGTWYIED